MLYRIKGLIEEDGPFIWNASTCHEEQGKINAKKVFYLEASSFQQATTKAKKAMDHIISVEEVDGEFLYE